MVEHSSPHQPVQLESQCRCTWEHADPPLVVKQALSPLAFTACKSWVPAHLLKKYDSHDFIEGKYYARVHQNDGYKIWLLFHMNRARKSLQKVILNSWYSPSFLPRDFIPSIKRGWHTQSVCNSTFPQDMKTTWVEVQDWVGWKGVQEENRSCWQQFCLPGHHQGFCQATQI